MAVRVRQSCWLVCFTCVLFSKAAAQSACSPMARASDLETCLQGIREAIVDTDRFWFGSDYLRDCPPQKQFTIECVTRVPITKAESIASHLFWTGTFDASTIDRYLDVVYTSVPGSYTGCSHNYEQKETLTLPPVDPLSSDIITPWNARGLPALTWDADKNKQYTVVIQDAGVLIVHGIYVNVPGNDMSKAEALDEYHGPLSVKRVPNIYTFLVFEQQNKDMDMSDFELPVGMSLSAIFNVSDFQLTQRLKGPVAASWIQVSHDPYSVQQARSWGAIENCSPFITDALEKENLPFISTDDTATPLPAFVEVSITNQHIDVVYCCKKTSYKSQTTLLDPIGNKNLPTAIVRSGSEVEVKITYNKMFPNITADFLGEYLTILCVDPDVPRAAVGTKARPLLHWLHIDAQVAADGTLVNGKDMLPYGGPKPPDYGNPHGYYFFVFQQNSELTFVNTSDYTGNCSERLKTRCLFSIEDLRAANQLTLLASSWMKAVNDDYVNVTNKVPESEACAGRPEYGDPCPTSDAMIVKSLTAIWLTAALTVYRVLHKAQ